MKQFNVPDEKKVHIDYYDKEMPTSVKVLKPVLYKQGDSFCVVLGPGPRAGVFGCGNSPIEALKDWDTHLQKRIKNKSDDQVAKFIIDILEPSEHKD